MPNWVRQQATFRGSNEALKKLESLICVTEERARETEEYNKRIDFCEIVRNARNGKKIAQCKKCNKKSCKYVKHLNPDAFKKDIPQVGSVDFGILIPQPELIYTGGTNDEIKKEVESLGGTDWYYWDIDNWGTKWNACDDHVEWEDDECLVVSFDTAWSMAEPWWIRVGEESQKLGVEIDGFYADEDFGGAMGTIHLNEYDDEITITCCSKDEDIYEDAWGYSPLEDVLQDELDSED